MGNGCTCFGSGWFMGANDGSPAGRAAAMRFCGCAAGLGLKNASQADRITPAEVDALRVEISVLRELLEQECAASEFAQGMVEQLESQIRP